MQRQIDLAQCPAAVAVIGIAIASAIAVPDVPQLQVGGVVFAVHAQLRCSNEGIKAIAATKPKPMISRAGAIA